nr:elongation-very long chain-fatty acids-protein-7 [Kerria lacca]
MQPRITKFEMTFTFSTTPIKIPFKPLSTLSMKKNNEILSNATLTKDYFILYFRMEHLDSVIVFMCEIRMRKILLVYNEKRLK